MPEPVSLSRQSAPSDEALSSTNRDEHVLEMRAARRAGVRWRRISRWLGLAIFVLGAVLLAYVFWAAFQSLQRFGSDAGTFNRDFNAISGDTIASVVQAALVVFGREILRVLYLLILGFVASAIAARGIQFFAASEAVIDEAVVPEE